MQKILLLICTAVEFNSVNALSYQTFIVFGFKCAVCSTPQNHAYILCSDHRMRQQWETWRWRTLDRFPRLITHRSQTQQDGRQLGSWMQEASGDSVPAEGGVHCATW